MIRRQCSQSPQDDPVQRRPDISFARKALDWEPKVALRDGLARTIDYFAKLRGGAMPGNDGRAG